MSHIWDKRENDNFYHIGAEPPPEKEAEHRPEVSIVAMVHKVEVLMGQSGTVHHIIVAAIPEDDIRPLFSSQRCGVLFRSYDLFLDCAALFRRLTNPYGDRVTLPEICELEREVEDLRSWVSARGVRIRICATGKCECPDRRALGINQGEVDRTPF